MTVIAEMCQNHNGDSGLLTEMVHSAAEAGASVIKFQLIFADMLSNRPRFETGEQTASGRQISIKRPYRAEYDRMKGLEIDDQVLADLADFCRSRGVKPMCTAFSIDSVARVKEMGFDALKIASYDCASTPLLECANANFDEIYVSTGATFKSEIEHAVKIIDADKLKLMHCVTIYPTPLKLLNLKKIQYLQELCGQVGFSDHSATGADGLKAAIAARFYGAQFVERHFTLLPEGDTKDGVVSINADHVRTLNSIYSAPRQEADVWLQENFPNFAELYKRLQLDLSEEELLNRDYYRGRFVSRLPSGIELSNHV